MQGFLRYRWTGYLLLFSLWLQGQSIPIGQWREHLPWNKAIQVISTSEKTWCATPFSVFSIDASDNSIDRWSKVNGLSETGVNAIGWDATTATLVIAYNNSTIDLIRDQTVTKLDALNRLPAGSNNTVYSIYTRNGLAYLSTGLGIVIADLKKDEIKDTYIIGTNGLKIPVFFTTVLSGFLYASTSEGLKKAPLTTVNLSDYRSWSLISGSNGLSAGATRQVGVFNNQVLLVKDDSLWIQNNNNWSLFFADGSSILSISDPLSGKLLVGTSNGITGKVLQMGTGGQIEQTIQNNNYTALPKQASFQNGEYWIADSIAGLTKWTGTAFISYNPNSPSSAPGGYTTATNEKFWIASGMARNLNADGIKNGLFQFSDNTWTILDKKTIAAMDSLPDIIPVTTDPSDASVWAGSFGGGLFNLSVTNTIKIFKQNSPLQPAIGAPGQYRISGLSFDGNNNLWISNYGAALNVQVRKPDGNWRSFSAPFPITENALTQIIVDDIDQKWIIAAKDQGLLCFNHGASIDNSNDDRWRWLRTGKGNGNLPDNGVLCIAKDKNGFIWVGTKKGIGIIQCPQEIFTPQGCEALLPVVQQDNFAGYLFRDEEVQCIAVDGADRKWVGTKNGVWLITSDAEKTIYRFNTSNSPLPDNDILQIGIDPKTGEVFFATAKGLVSFRSTATEASSTYQNVLVFPNPVPPQYNGTIAIRGLVNNAVVKITELDGRLVYETRALGGQAIWNGYNYKGQKVSTGVYLVMSVDDSHKEKMVTKIIFIGKQP